VSERKRKRKRGHSIAENKKELNTPLSSEERETIRHKKKKKEKEK